MRLVSLVAGLALVVVLMQVARSPATVEKLGLMFGEPRPSGPTERSVASQPASLPEIDSRLLETIEDNTTFRDEESAAWFHLLSVVRDASREQLSHASVGELAYAQLLGQPHHYRGRVVRIDGNARRVEVITPAANSAGIEQLYRVVVQPGRDVLRPFMLYCHELPVGWTATSTQPNNDLPNDGRMVVDAVFFKNKVYNHQHGVDLTPVFVSRSLTPVDSPDMLVDRTPSLPLWQLVALAAVAAAAIVSCIALRTTAPPQRRYTPDAVDVAEDLRAIESTAERG